MNTIQSLITLTPLGRVDFQVYFLIASIILFFVTLIGAGLALDAKRKKTSIALFTTSALLIAAFLSMCGLRGTLRGEAGQISRQSCIINSSGIQLWGEETTNLPEKFQVAGKTVTIDNWGEPASITTNKFFVEGKGWTVLKLLGLKNPIETELGINASLQKELEKIVGTRASGISVALQTESPKFAQVLGKFTCRGTTKKTIYGTETEVFFDVKISGSELQAMIKSPIIAKEMERVNLIAKK